MAMILVLAGLLDFILGDPWNWPHPVQAMGWGIDWYTQSVFNCRLAPRIQRGAGVLLGVGLIGISGWIGWLLVWGATTINRGLGLGLTVIVLAACFAGRSLRDAAEAVLVPLERGDLLEARSHLGHYVGRDTASLSTAEVQRATLETVAENSVDGVMAPLFYSLVGAVVWPEMGPLPLALAYKAASTLDSMVGYREAPYQDLGWFSARLEDALTWVPCRLTVITLALLSGYPRNVWRLCSRDAPADPSPNAGWSECAYAAVLGVQLGGTNTYQGVVKQKPLLGEVQRSITPLVIRQALALSRRCFLLWLGFGILGILVRPW